jgi:hypothetical protein
LDKSSWREQDIIPVRRQGNIRRILYETRAQLAQSAHLSIHELHQLISIQCRIKAREKEIVSNGNPAHHGTRLYPGKLYGRLTIGTGLPYLSYAATVKDAVRAGHHREDVWGRDAAQTVVC